MCTGGYLPHRASADVAGVAGGRFSCLRKSLMVAQARFRLGEWSTACQRRICFECTADERARMVLRSRWQILELEQRLTEHEAAFTLEESSIALLRDALTICIRCTWLHMFTLDSCCVAFHSNLFYTGCQSQNSTSRSCSCRIQCEPELRSSCSSCQAALCTSMINQSNCTLNVLQSGVESVVEAGMRSLDGQRYAERFQGGWRDCTIQLFSWKRMCVVDQGFLLFLLR